jgi:uncharacterized protein (TIGR02246 family)
MNLPRSLAFILVVAATCVVGDAAAGDATHVRAAIERLDTVANAHDAKALAALYVVDADQVQFYDALPFQVKGRAGVVSFIDALFAETSNWHQQTEVEQLLVGAEVAAATCVQRASWSDAGAEHSQVARYTVVFQNVGGRWLVWHEHYSVPFDEKTGKAVFDATP